MVISFGIKIINKLTEDHRGSIPFCGMKNTLQFCIWDVGGLGVFHFRHGHIDIFHHNYIGHDPSTNGTTQFYTILDF